MEEVFSRLFQGPILDSPSMKLLLAKTLKSSDVIFIFSFLYLAIVLDIQIIKPTICTNVLLNLQFKTFYTY